MPDINLGPNIWKQPDANWSEFDKATKDQAEGDKKAHDTDQVITERVKLETINEDATKTQITENRIAHEILSGKDNKATADPVPQSEKTHYRGW